MNDPRVCDSWIQCVNGEAISGSCDSGYFYDRQSQDCLPSDKIQCLASEPCKTISDGFEADPYSCNGYYYCKEGKGTLGKCKTGYNYNPATESCIPDFPCSPKMDPLSYCNVLPDGVFIKDQANCNGYQLCWKGDVISDTCTDTFYFDPVHGQCDYPENVECAHTAAPPPIADPELCPQPNIFVADSSTCSGYYYCQPNELGHINLVPGKCPPGRFFLANAQLGKCVQREKIRCDYDRCSNAGYGFIELTNLTDDECRGFGICQDGRTIGQGTCPDGEYFDELIQRCSTRIVSYPACAQKKGTTSRF